MRNLIHTVLHFLSRCGYTLLGLMMGVAYVAVTACLLLWVLVTPTRPDNDTADSVEPPRTRGLGEAATLPG